MNARIHRSGRERALRIPAEIAEELGLRVGSSVTLRVDLGRLIVAPESAPFVTLDELLAGVTDENRHGETDWRAPVGNEVW